MTSTVAWVDLMAFLTAVVTAFFLGRSFDTSQNAKIKELEQRISKLEKSEGNHG